MVSRRLLRPASRVIDSFARTTTPSSTASSWICPSCITPLLRQQQQSSQRRHASGVPGAPYRDPHTAVRQTPILPYHEYFREKGIPGLFSKTGYLLGWTSYQAMIVQKLNALTDGDDIYANATPQSLALTFARDPQHAALFNHASMAHNNHFFYSGLSTGPVPLDQKVGLKASLEETFGSIETLRATFINTADAMFGPGFVWLVWQHKDASEQQGSWKILNTYLAGTPYAEAAYRRQSEDMATNSVGSMGPYSPHGKQMARIPPGGAKVTPVLCVNTWEHVYIYDFGVDGKKAFLRKWWDAVDWSVVDNVVGDAYTKEGSRPFQRK